MDHTERPYSDDWRLVQQILAPGTREAGFRELVMTYQSRLYWLIRGMLGQHEDTNDVLQNTLLKVASQLHTFKGQAALQTWMYRIAVNECRTFLSAAKRTVQHKSNLTPPSEMLVTSDMTAENAMATLERAVQTLPEKQKIVFCLRYFDGLAYDDIQTMTGTSVGALKASYHHAVKKIEQYISNEEIIF